MNTSFARKPAESTGIARRGNQLQFFDAANPLAATRPTGLAGKERVDILYLDEQSDLLGIMGDFFRRNGMSVITATSAELAMRLPDEWSVGVMVIDVSVAGEEGGELVRFLRRNHPATPIILRTPAQPTGTGTRFARRGVTRCVPRSESPETLLAAIQELCTK